MRLEKLVSAVIHQGEKRKKKTFGENNESPGPSSTGSSKRGQLLWVGWGAAHRTYFKRCLWESCSLLVTTKQPI